jgi:cytochrome c oxidase subunit 1
MRAPGITMHDCLFYVWAVLITSFLLILSLPVFWAITMLLTDRNFNTTFMILGGGILCYTNTYFGFGHLSLYLDFTWFGIVSHIIKNLQKNLSLVIRDGLCYDFNRCLGFIVFGPIICRWFRY